MSFLSAIIVGAAAVEILLRLPALKYAQNILTEGQNALETIRSEGIPEQQKQRLLLGSAWTTFASTCCLAVQLLIWAVLTGLIFLLLSRLFDHESRVVSEPGFLAAATAAAAVYAIIRKRFA